MELTEEDNTFLEKFKGKLKTTKKDKEKEVRKSKYYTEATDQEITVAVDRIYDKLQTINSEYMQWFEFLMAFVFAIAGFMAPIWLLYFQKKMRQLEMEEK